MKTLIHPEDNRSAHRSRTVALASRSLLAATLLVLPLASCGDDSTSPSTGAMGGARGGSAGVDNDAADPSGTSGSGPIATGHVATGQGGSGGDGGQGGQGSTAGASAGGSGPVEDAGREIPDAEVPDGPLVGDDETTLSILRSRGPACASCAMMNGCLDPAQMGGACEDTAGVAPAACQAVFNTTSQVTETKVCLATLKMIFRSHCSMNIIQTPCFCGLTDRDMCMAGTAAPTGPGVDLYTCDLGSTGIQNLVRDFWEQKRGAGQANAIIECLGALGCECDL